MISEDEAAKIQRRGRVRYSDILFTPWLLIMKRTTFLLA